MKATEITSAVHAYEECSDTFPNIEALLRILCTLPVTTMEAERLFSKVQSTLTAVRATMTEQQVYRSMLPTTDEVLERYAKKDRRLVFSQQVYQSEEKL